MLGQTCLSKTYSLCPLIKPHQYTQRQSQQRLGMKILCPFIAIIDKKLQVTCNIA